MMCYSHNFQKIVNPALARRALHDAQAYGEYKIYVRLAKPGHAPPSMKMVKFFAPDFVKGRVPCDKIGKLADDANVVSVELREHITAPAA